MLKRKRDNMLEGYHTISELALRLSRSSQTVRKWEKNGIIPPTIFRYGNKRMYHEKQIELICKLAEESNIDSKTKEALRAFSVQVYHQLKILNETLIHDEKGINK